MKRNLAALLLPAILLVSLADASAQKAGGILHVGYRDNPPISTGSRR
jgi:hypothetical protein